MASKNVVRLLRSQSKLISSSPPRSFIESSRCYASWEPQDKITHTGQLFEPDDIRLARFVNKTKEVNNNWAVKLIDEVPPMSRKERIVVCNGGDEHLGHPRVYINLDKPGNHTCGYCGLRYFKEDHH